MTQNPAAPSPRKIAGSFGICQLPPDARTPPWADGPGFTAQVRSDDELTLICREDRIPLGQKSELGWACFRSIGPFAFDEAGVVASLISPISAAGIGVFVVCTFDGEHILCPEADFEKVAALLQNLGHDFDGL